MFSLVTERHSLTHSIENDNKELLNYEGKSIK